MKKRYIELHNDPKFTFSECIRAGDHIFIGHYGGYIDEHHARITIFTEFLDEECLIQMDDVAYSPFKNE
ncbi:MAG: hypothetical protein P8Y70_21125 [Candidatus Lokiarchaeota archaeon]